MSLQWITTLVLLNLSSTFLMTGVIWTIEWVHYPLFADVGRDNFVHYEAKHTRAISGLVIPLMLTELISTCLLLKWHPAWLSSTFQWAGLMLVLGAWGITFLWSVPAHTQLAKAFSVDAHQQLLRSNHARTLCWTSRTGLWIYLLSQHLLI